VILSLSGDKDQVETFVKIFYR